MDDLNGPGQVDAWIPLKLSLIAHRKIFKLKRLAGFKTLRDARGCVASLFLFTLQNAWRDGNLAAWEVADIEQFLEWEGDAGGLVSALQECGNDGEPGFLDKNMKVKDWEFHANRLIDGRLGRKNRHYKSRGVVPPPEKGLTPKEIADAEIKRRARLQGA